MAYVNEYKGMPDSELLSHILYHYASDNWLTPKQKKALKRAIKRARRAEDKKNDESRDTNEHSDNTEGEARRRNDIL